LETIIRPNIRKAFQRLSPEKMVPAGLILLGLVLRLRQYLAGRSLWLDEAMLALNITARSFAGLLQPLDYEQGAPLGFLLAEKLAITLLGNNEFSLRLLPLLAGCAALLLFALLLRQVVGKIGTLTALTLFAAGGPLIYYASEVKQYSCDVFIALLLLWLAARYMRLPQYNRDVVILGLVGALALWFSHPALFVLAGVGTTLFLHDARQKDIPRLKHIVAVIVVWGLSFGILYFVSLRGLASDSFLLDYWAEYFMPMPPWADLTWFPETLKGVLDNPAGLGTFWVLAALLMLVGLLVLLRRSWQFGALFGLTLAAALAASALGKYPFAGRMILFLVPVFLALIGAGLQAVADWFRRPPWLGTGVAILLAALLLYQPLVSAAQNFASPKYYEHVRPTMAYLQTNRKPGDVLYVYSWAVPAFRYYAPFYGFTESDFMAGNEHKNDPQGLLAEIDRLRGGKRIWVLFSHVYEKGDYNEKDFILAHLDEIGDKKREFRAPGTSVLLVLYDLSR
jgi:uncharacterized membrane protein